MNNFLNGDFFNHFLTVLLKYGLLCLLILYFCFALIVHRQINSMKQTLITPIALFITILGFINILLTIFVFIIIISLI